MLKQHHVQRALSTQLRASRALLQGSAPTTHHAGGNAGDVPASWPTATHSTHEVLQHDPLMTCDTAVIFYSKPLPSTTAEAHSKADQWPCTLVIWHARGRINTRAQQPLAVGALPLCCWEHLQPTTASLCTNAFGGSSQHATMATHDSMHLHICC
jgi:hypothetical protein